jgi:type I restriction enzyme S subunit
MALKLRGRAMPETLKRFAGTTVAFGDIVQLSKARSKNPEADGFERFVGLEHLAPSDLKVRDWGDIADGTTFTSVFKPGQVLFGKRRAYLRKVAVADFCGVCSGDIYVLEPKGDRLLPELLPFICQSESFFDYVISMSQGGLSPRVNWKSLSNYEFELPSIPDQQRIADTVQAAEESLQKTDELARALKTVFTARFEHYLAAAESRHSLTPVAELLSEPPRNGLSPATNSDGLGFKTVSISAVSNGRFDPEENIKFAEVDRDKASPYFVKAGDVFAVRGNGNRYLTGKVGIAREDHEDMFYPDLLIRLRFDATKVLTLFALSQWNLPSVHRRLIARAKSSNGIWKVNGQDIRSHALLVPGLSEQRQILEALEVLQAQGQKCEQRRRELVSLKMLLLRTLPRGR